MTPVLLINDKVLVMGYVPDKEYIKTAIKEHIQRGENSI
jgi:hypothetical protein